MKRCKIAPTSCRYLGRPCCKDCTHRECTVRCLNTPERCGCMEETPPPRKRSKGNGGGRFLDWDEMARLHGLGLAQREIARRLDCNPATVYNALKKMGVNGRGQS